MTLDLKGLPCPVPLIRAQKAIEKMQLHDEIICIGDDPIFLKSMKDLVKTNKIELSIIKEDGRTIHLLLKRVI